jgi:PEP-CTERM motif-containing protein
MFGRSAWLCALVLATASFAVAGTLVIAGTNTSGTLRFSAAAQNSTVTDQDVNIAMALAFTPTGTGVYDDIGFSVAAELSGGSTAIFSIYDDDANAGYPVDLLGTTQLFGLPENSFQLISGSFENLTLTGGDNYYLVISLPDGVPGNQTVDMAGTRQGTLGFFESHEFRSPPSLWTTGFGGLPAYQITGDSVQAAPEPSIAGLMSLALGAIAFRLWRRKNRELERRAAQDQC